MRIDGYFALAGSLSRLWGLASPSTRLSLLASCSALTTLLSMSDASFAASGEDRAAKIVFLGDSITHGVGTSRPNRNSFAVIAANILGCSYAKLGVGGAQMESLTTRKPSQKAASFVAAVRTHEDAIASSSVLVIAYGTNDYSRDVPIGNITDSHQGTFFGAMHEGLAAVRENNPAVRVVFLTPTFRTVSKENATEDSRFNDIGFTLEDYRQAIRQFAEKNGVEVVEGRKHGRIEADNVFALTRDGLHLNDRGAELIGMILAEALQSCR